MLIAIELKTLFIDRDVGETRQNKMVKAIIDIKKETNRILNVIKARHGYRTKSEAIDHLARIHPEAKVAKRRTVERLEEKHDLKRHREIYG